MNGGRDVHRNPASPAFLGSTSWDASRASSATPTSSASTTHSPLLPAPKILSPRLPPQVDDALRTPRTPISPTRTKSMSDFVIEQGWDGSLPPSILDDHSRDSSREVLGSFEEPPEPPEPPQSMASRESCVNSMCPDFSLLRLHTDDRQVG